MSKNEIAFITKTEKHIRSGTSVETIAKMWLYEKQPYIKPSSYARYNLIIRKYIVLPFGRDDILNFDGNFLSQYSRKLTESLKPKTVRDILTVLKQIMAYAEESSLCSVDLSRIKYPKGGSAVVSVLTVFEQSQLQSYLTENIDTQKLGVLICLYTGLRLGEICALRWEDIDLNSGVIKIRRTVQRICKASGGTEFLIDSPKSENSVRNIPLPDSLAEQMKNFRCDDMALYFLTGTSQFMQPRTYQNRFKAYLRTAGLDESYHFHSLRHTFASRAIELHFDPKTLSELLGHSSVGITLNRYVHSTIEQKRKSMRLFDKQLQG